MIANWKRCAQSCVVICTRSETPDERAGGAREGLRLLGRSCSDEDAGKAGCVQLDRLQRRQSLQFTKSDRHARIRTRDM